MKPSFKPQGPARVKTLVRMFHTFGNGLYSDDPSGSFKLCSYTDGSTWLFNEKLLYTQPTQRGDIIVLVSQDARRLLSYTAVLIADYRAHGLAVAAFEQERTA